jgi:signal transduction histidine kinase
MWRIECGIDPPPHQFCEPSDNSPAHVEQIAADGKTYRQSLRSVAASNLSLPARTRDVQIDYTALIFVAPEKAHFKYKLEGQDPDWREVVNDRDVQYSNLGPGTYRFRVIACNNSAIWNEQGDTLEFSIAPAYYQRNWFRALCAVLVLALAWAIYQYRVRQLHREFPLTLDALVAERTNIARELHNTLLQSFHGLMLRFEIVSQLLPDCPVEAKEKLDGAMKQAAEAITEGRDAVQGLRASTVQTNDLARASQMIQQTMALRHFASRLKARRAICIPSRATRSTELPPRRCGTPSTTLLPDRSR